MLFTTGNILKEGLLFDPVRHNESNLILSYVNRADDLPTRFWLRVTHVEEDGFRFWGRPLLETKLAKGPIDEAEFYAGLDDRMMNRVESEVEGVVEYGNLEGAFGEKLAILERRPVVVFHGGRWHRGWTMKTDEGEENAPFRVFLVDVGRALASDCETVMPWKEGLFFFPTLPLAMPFFLKGDSTKKIINWWHFSLHTCAFHRKL